MSDSKLLWPWSFIYAAIFRPIPQGFDLTFFWFNFWHCPRPDIDAAWGGQHSFDARLRIDYPPSV